jgi:hypothetical protein
MPLLMKTLIFFFIASFNCQFEGDRRIASMMAKCLVVRYAAFEMRRQNNVHHH